jgi:hypothetical protein
VTVKRLLAFLGAVALIVGAVFLRDALDNKSSDATSSTDKPSGGKATVICSTEFEAVCKQLDPKRYTITIESAGDTLDRLAKNGAQPPDAWVTLDPFPGMIDETRTFLGRPALVPKTVAVATDVPKFGVPSGRETSVTAACSGGALWKCLGTAAGKTWADVAGDGTGGQVLVGLQDPATEALGLVTLANGVSGYFGSPSLDAGSWTDSGFRSWLRNISARVKVSIPGTTPLSTLLSRPTDVNVAATTASEIASIPATRTGDVVALDVIPAIPIVAVVATFGSRAGELAAAIKPLLVSSGLTSATDPNPKLSAGTFVALRTLWKDNNK